MNLYLISQDANRGYDTYDSAIVCAETEGEARAIHPSGGLAWDGKIWTRPGAAWSSSYTDWTVPDAVQCKLVGVAEPAMPWGVVLASFNAGCHARPLPLPLAARCRSLSDE